MMHCIIQDGELLAKYVLGEQFSAGFQALQEIYDRHNVPAVAGMFEKSR